MATDRDFLDYMMSFLSERRQDLFNQVLAERTRHITVLVEELYQPHNTNAVLRSCECFGIQDVHVIEDVNEFDISRRISMGSHKWLDIHKYNNTEDGIASLKKKGYTVVATCLSDEAIAPEEYDISVPTAFLFGTEKTGLSKTALNAADVHMKIPMRGFTESFNISVSAALILYHFTKTLRSSKAKWSLAENEKDELKIKWLQEHLKAFDKMKEYYYEEIENKT